MTVCVHGPDGLCGRKTAVRDMCMSHYRGWRAGKPLDRPLRGYVRYVADDAGLCVVAPIRKMPPRRKAFSAEKALLRELGLR